MTVFKKLMSECKKGNMVYKTATGISNYRYEKNYSKRFDLHLPLIKSHNSYQLDLLQIQRVLQTFNIIKTESNTSKNSEALLFVPRPAKKKDKLAETTAEILQSVQSLMHNEQMSALLQFKERENARAHKLEILKLPMPLHSQSSLNELWLFRNTISACKSTTCSTIFCITICIQGL